MTELRLVPNKPRSPASPILSKHPLPTHLRLLPKHSQLSLFDYDRASENDKQRARLWGFCANIDQLAMRNTRENIGLGIFAFVQDFFVALQNAKSEKVRMSNFLVWVEGHPLYLKHASGRRDRPFWMLYIAAEDLSGELIEFTRSFIRSQTGWKAVGWVSRFAKETFPMFQYRRGEPMVFFTRIEHPNGDSSVGHPEFFYRSEDLYLGFGSVPKPMKYASLEGFFDEPMTFTVRMMDEILPGFTVNVDVDLKKHPCGLTEPELIALSPEWDSYTDNDKNLLRQYGPVNKPYNQQPSFF